MAETERARTFATTLKERLEGRLDCALLYGSAARGEYRPGSSDLNLLVILPRLGPVELAALVEPTREWIESGNPPPLMMSSEEWRRSADVFPIEYSDIREAHEVLIGSDPFTGIAVERRHLRLQLEHELRSKKIQLREGYLAAGGDPERLGALIVGSLSTFLTLFRAVLRLAGSEVPADAEQLVDQVGTEIGFDPGGVKEVLRAKRNGNPISESIDGAIASGYLMAVEKTAEWLDRYQAGDGVAAQM